MEFSHDPFVRTKIIKHDSCSVKSLGKFYLAIILKTTDITVILKKDNRTNKNNSRPISTNPDISKVFEKCMYYHVLHTCDMFLYLKIMILPATLISTLRILVVKL